MQTRLHSFLEALAATAIGFIVSMGISLVVYPLFGHAFTLAQNFWITAIFTISSILRGYAVRRLFNRLHRGRPMPPASREKPDPINNEMRAIYEAQGAR